MGTAEIFYLIIIGMIAFSFILTLSSIVFLHVAVTRKNKYEVKMKEADDYYEKRVKEADTYAAKVKQQTDLQYKKLISLTPRELDEYLGLLFGYFLELNSEARVSEKDPDANVKLYANTLSSMLEYVGDETIQALDYYYGDSYVEKWCQLRFMLLENRRIASKIINKEYDFSAIQNNTTGA